MRVFFTFLFYFKFSYVILFSQAVVTYNFSGQPGNQTTTPVSSTASGWSATAIVRGSGITANAGADSMNSTNWTTSSSRDASDYYEFTVTTPNTGGSHTLTLSLNIRRSSTGPADYEITQNGTVIGSDTNISSSNSGNNVILDNLGPFGNNIIITYRIYGYSSTGGTMRLQNSITLPVQFSKFNAQAKNKTTNISFSTASETNNDYFTIERSGDGRSFESIGEIKGAGNSNQELSYEFVDENPLAGINFYRIKQTDFDGAYSYTEIRSVRHQTKNVIVSPNRTDGKLNVTSELDNYDVVIYNTGGQEVQRHMALSGDQSLSIETLQAGVYFVKVIDQTIRILKF